jgi:hypothetical protein
MPNNHFGKLNPNYKDGRWLKEYFCINCNKKISKWSGLYGKYKLCRICFLKFKSENWKNNNPQGKRIKHFCVDCNKELSKDSSSKKRCWKCYVKWAQISENNPNYIDGTSGLYPLEFNEELKENIRKFDNYICQNCGMTEEEHLITIGTILNVHHIDYNKKNCNKNNLITLCRQCNLRANYNREYWKELYEIKIKELKCESTKTLN